MSKAKRMIEQSKKCHFNNGYIPKAEELFQLAEEMEEAMAIFVDRVKKGTIRSKTTYVQFKKILNREPIQ